MGTLPFKISTLVFLRDRRDRLLLIQRRKAPNLGCWSPVGGKLDMTRGESPYECARREVGEEVGIELEDSDLRLFGYISEKAYEGDVHWLMFLFDCRVLLEALPPTIDEGHFATLLWPYYDRYREGFVGLRADCGDPLNLRVVEELKIDP